MTKILFVCHGNICRSPMVEYIMKDMIQNKNLSSKFVITSAAVSNEELGNDIYPPAKRKLKEKGIPFSAHRARKVSKEDYDDNDYIICMDNNNLAFLKRFYDNDPEEKISLLLDRPVSDPWYTGDFESTYNDLVLGISQLIENFGEKQ